VCKGHTTLNCKFSVSLCKKGVRIFAQASLPEFSRVDPISSILILTRLYIRCNDAMLMASCQQLKIELHQTKKSKYGVQKILHKMKITVSVNKKLSYFRRWNTACPRLHIKFNIYILCWVSSVPRSTHIEIIMLTATWRLEPASRHDCSLHELNADDRSRPIVVQNTGKGKPVTAYVLLDLDWRMCSIVECLFPICLPRAQYFSSCSRPARQLLWRSLKTVPGHHEVDWVSLAYVHKSRRDLITEL
jgi:hypothetical protein